MNRNAAIVIAIVAVIAVGVSVTLTARGCHGDDGLSGTQQVQASRLDQIVKKTGGDWSKLTQEDKDFLVKDLSHGDENSARMLLLAQSGQLKGAPGK